MKKFKLLSVVAAGLFLFSCGGKTSSASASSTSSATTSSSAATSSVTPASTTSSAAESSQAPAVEAKLIKSYIGTFNGGYYIPAYSMLQSGYDNYVVDLYDDNTYVSNKVTYMDMYGTAGSVVITTTGSYSTSENKDGDKIVSLSDAASILYTTCGMFNFQYSYGVTGMEDSTFPVSLMGSSSASDTLDFFKSEYGFGYSFMTADSDSLMTEVYMPESYVAHFPTQEEQIAKVSSVAEGETVATIDYSKYVAGVVNPYTGDVKAHDFKKNIKHVYVGTFAGGYYIPAYSMLQAGYDNYAVTTFDDGSYDVINVKWMNMYGTIGSVTLETTGKYTESENKDGDPVISIAAADSISYTTCGMFNYQFTYGVTGMEDSTFPVALLGSSAASDTLDFFKSEYGYAFSFTASAQTNSLITELTLPEDIAAHYVVEAPADETGDSSTTGE